MLSNPPEFEFIRQKSETPEMKEFSVNTFCTFTEKVTGGHRMPFAIEVRQNENLIGIGEGYSFGNELYWQKIIFCEAFRGQGLGKQLYAEIEKIARERSCMKIWVDTFSYQAPEFYKKLGFSEHTVIQNYRGKYNRIFFVKEI